MFVVTSVAWLLAVSPGFEACRRAFGHDFLAFYVAGSFAAEGRHQDLYDLEAVRAREQAVAREAGLALGDAVGPWWNPPAYAWVFAPLAGWPFGWALATWCGINVAALAGTLWVLCRLRPGAGPLIPLLVVVSAPFLQSLTHGQNSAISLLLMTGIACAWRRRQDVLAGALAGLLLYKPQLAAAVSVVLVAHRGWRAAAGLAAVAAATLVVTMLTMPGALSDYLHRLPANLHVMQVENTYLWERHVTLKAFWRLLLQGRGPGETSTMVHLLTAATALPFAAALLRRAWRHRPGDEDGLIAATVATAPLLMPFYFDYDLLLLAVPAALGAGLGAGLSRRRWVVGAWCGLYLWLYVNPYVGGFVRVNLAVPLLAALAGGLLVTSADPDEVDLPRLSPLAEAA